MFLREHSRFKDGKEHGYWSLVETIRTADGPRQRTLCYLGELNGSAYARWQKTVEVFNEQGETTQLKLFPSEVETPNDPNIARRQQGTPGGSRKIFLTSYFSGAFVLVISIWLHFIWLAVGSTVKRGT